MRRRFQEMAWHVKRLTSASHLTGYKSRTACCGETLRHSRLRRFVALLDVGAYGSTAREWNSKAANSFVAESTQDGALSMRCRSTSSDALTTMAKEPFVDQRGFT
jgi:hypothetical protein